MERPASSFLSVFERLEIHIFLCRCQAEALKHRKGEATACWQVIQTTLSPTTLVFPASHSEFPRVSLLNRNPDNSGSRSTSLAPTGLISRSISFGLSLIRCAPAPTFQPQALFSPSHRQTHSLYYLWRWPQVTLGYIPGRFGPTTKLGTASPTRKSGQPLFNVISQVSF